MPYKKLSIGKLEGKLLPSSGLRSSNEQNYSQI